MEDLEKKSLSRREFLKVAGIAGATIGVGAGLGGALAACGGGTTTTTAGATTTTVSSSVAAGFGQWSESVFACTAYGASAPVTITEIYK